jgi:hypothetical protein
VENARLVGMGEGTRGKRRFTALCETHVGEAALCEGSLVTEQRINRFFTNLESVLGHCLIEGTEVLIPVVLAVSCLCVIYLLGVFVYDFVLDSNSVDVASRLSSLSIDADRWKFLS